MGRFCISAPQLHGTLHLGRRLVNPTGSRGLYGDKGFATMRNFEIRCQAGGHMRA